MATDVEIDRALATVQATLNDQRWHSFERARVEEIVRGSLGGERTLRVDAGGGLHNADGTRVGVIRRGGDGVWLVERQNAGAVRSEAEVPAAE